MIKKVILGIVVGILLGFQIHRELIIKKIRRKLISQRYQIKLTQHKNKEIWEFCKEIGDRKQRKFSKKYLKKYIKDFKTQIYNLRERL